MASESILRSREAVADSNHAPTVAAGFPTTVATGPIADPQPYVYSDGYRTVDPQDGWSGEPIYQPRSQEELRRIFNGN